MFGLSTSFLRLWLEAATRQFPCGKRAKMPFTGRYPTPRAYVLVVGIAVAEIEYNLDVVRDAAAISV
jgi:hypothetical protein